MHGKVLEWCEDGYGAYNEGATADPPGPRRGPYRVLRGGAFLVSADWCRSACRNWDLPDGRDDGVGFRVLLPGPAAPMG